MTQMAAAVAALLLALQAATPAPSPLPSPPPGDAAFAAGNFRTAFAEYQHTLRDDPNDVHALAAAGTIELYGNDLTDAQRDLRAAANAGDDLAVHELTNLAKRTAPFNIKQGKGTETIRLVSTDPIPIVQITVNGKKANFFVDTGAASVVLAASFAKSLGLDKRTSIAIQRLTIGPITVANISADVVPLRSPPGPFQMGGVLGTGFLSHFLTTIDYARGTLRLLPKGAAAQRKTEFADADTTPMWLVGDRFIFAHAHVNVAPEVLFAIDTGGAGFGVELTKASLDAAHIALNPYVAQTFLTDLTLGKTTTKDLLGMYTPGADIDGMFPFAVGGTIGHGYFRHMRVTFDFNAMRIYLQ